MNYSGDRPDADLETSQLGKEAFGIEGNQPQTADNIATLQVESQINS